MNPKEKAHNIRRIANDDTYKDMMADIKKAQTTVFLDSSATMEQIEQAHHVIKGVSKIEEYIQSILDEEAIYDKKQ